MTIRETLATRISLNDIHEIISRLQPESGGKQEIYELLFDEDETVSYQAAWALSHFSAKDNEWLYDKQDQLINKAINEHHAGKRRIILQMLYRQPFATPPRVDFLDYCLEKMISKSELPAVQSSCIKLAYEMCRQIPELLGELKSILEMMEPEHLTPATRSARNHVFKAMRSGKSLQKLK
jgi:hypothetical protein